MHVLVHAEIDDDAHNKNHYHPGNGPGISGNLQARLSSSSVNLQLRCRLTLIRKLAPLTEGSFCLFQEGKNTSSSRKYQPLKTAPLKW